MQNKHFFSFLGNPNVRGGGGGQAGWDKIPTYRPNFYSEGSPKEKEEIVVTIKANLIFWTNIGG